MLPPKGDLGLPHVRMHLFGEQRQKKRRRASPGSESTLQTNTTLYASVATAGGAKPSCFACSTPTGIVSHRRAQPLQIAQTLERLSLSSIFSFLCCSSSAIASCTRSCRRASARILRVRAAERCQTCASIISWSTRSSARPVENGCWRNHFFPGVVFHDGAVLAYIVFSQ